MSTSPDATAPAPSERELVITRVLAAPPALVFRVWTEPAHLARWWGPKDFTMPSHRAEVRPGGAYRICIRSPEGEDYWMRGVYREVVEPERLVFTFAWEEEGERGVENLVRVAFAPHARGTQMRFHQGPFLSVEERDGHFGGWSECMDRLEAYLEAMGRAEA